MKRRFEIIDESERYYRECPCDVDRSDIQEAFVQGAQWADKTMIEKAVEWLQKYFVEDHYGMSPSGFCVFADMFIKAMEE